MSSIQNIAFKKMDGTQGTLQDFAGKVLLLVNVASKCGLTPQYEGLEKIQREYQGQGFTVLGFPANDFLAQEPGSNEEIEQFCKLTYDVTFPVFQKITVKGENKHPLYKELIKAQPQAIQNEGGSLKAKLEKIGQTPDSDSGILWNFEKFLVDQKGQVVARFAPDVTPDSKLVQDKIKSLL